MSVFTTVSNAQLEHWLKGYALGSLQDLQGISAGIENTNYFVTTRGGRFVLTLFESIGFDDLPYYLDLMAFMAEHGVPSAHPLPDRQGRYLRTLKTKPAALVQRLSGTSVRQPNRAQCQAIGAALGHLHAQGKGFPGFREHTRGPYWRRQTAEALLPHLPDADAELLREELAFQSRYSRAGLPWGVIHADLFRDNALFVADQLTGILDFYFACNSVLLFDVAVTVNDWCCYEGRLDQENALALLTAYHQERPLEACERGVWPAMLRVAALRFWLSRLRDQLFPRPGALIQIKDPNEFRDILRAHIAQSAVLPELWV